MHGTGDRSILDNIAELTNQASLELRPDAATGALAAIIGDTRGCVIAM